MENLLFSLNATIPIFLMMVAGYFFNKIGVINKQFADNLNKFVFKIALPVLLFRDLSTSDFYTAWDTKFVLFCFAATLISILLMTVISYFFKDKSIRGEFIQASFRSSAALLGCAYVQNIYGEAGASASLMIIGAVPLYNVTSVAILTILKPEGGKINKELIKKTLKGVITNPIIIGILAGMLWSLAEIPQPQIIQKSVSYIASTATPLGLMALGASFEFKKAFDKIKPALICSAFKLVIFEALFLPAAIFVMGFRQDKLVSILVMLGAATTVSCFTMAKSMGHEGTLSSSTVMMTTLLSAFTLTGWVYIVKTAGLI